MSQQHGARRSQALRGLTPFLVDAVAPIAAYFGLRALGVADLFALMAGGGVAACDAAVSLAIERRVRPLPIFVCITFALTGAVAFATHDPRVLLLKASIASAGIGLYLVALSASLAFLNRALEPLIARGSDARAARWEQAWRERPALRARIRLACGLAGLLLLVEAAARAAIVLRVTIGRSLFLAHGPAALAVVAIGLIVRFIVTPAVVRAMGDEEAARKRL